MEDGKVNLFVVGAMRAGTTSFMQLLSRHPNIYVSPIKEPHYFVDSLPNSIFEPLQEGFVDRYFKKQFPKPIHRARITNAEEYQKLFSLAQHHAYRAEGSISYLHAPEAAKKIHEYNPNAKIVIISRNPLQRAVSHYKMDLGLLREKKPMESVIIREMTAYKEGTLKWSSLLGMSFYNDPILRFNHYFGKKVLHLTSEELFQETEKTLLKVSVFLGIEDFSDVQFESVNATRKLRFQKMFFWLKKIGLIRFLSWVVPTTVKHKIFHSVSTPSNSEIHLSEKTLEELNDIFTIESSCHPAGLDRSDGLRTLES
ncbi:MAG: sulfotransferase [Bacteroidota bacterium]